jgi:hypothetical protein
MSVCNQKVLRPAISTQVFLVFLRLYASAEVVPSCYRVLLMQPLGFEFIKIQPPPPRWGNKCRKSKSRGQQTRSRTLKLVSALLALAVFVCLSLIRFSRLTLNQSSRRESRDVSTVAPFTPHKETAPFLVRLEALSLTTTAAAALLVSRLHESHRTQRSRVGTPASRSGQRPHSLASLVVFFSPSQKMPGQYFLIKYCCTTRCRRYWERGCLVRVDLATWLRARGDKDTIGTNKEIYRKLNAEK